MTVDPTHAILTALIMGIVFFLMNFLGSMAIEYLKNKRSSSPNGVAQCVKSIFPLLNGINIRLKDIDHKVRDLHIWHDRQDKDGVPVWYVRSSLEGAINSLAENISRQTDILEAQTRAYDNVISRLQKIDQEGGKTKD